MVRAHARSLRQVVVILTGCLAVVGSVSGKEPFSAPPATPATTLPSASPRGEGEFVNRVLTDETGEHKYVVFVPGNYTPDKEWPVILFLHGACNRGCDGRAQLVSGLAPAIRLRMKDYPFLVVFPQCENTESRVLGGWTDQPEDAERALKMLDAVEQDYRVDRKRECLVGLSMGGSGVWHIAAQNPDRWAALVPVSAMANSADAPRVAGPPTWVFHAASDPLVNTQIAKGMVDAINTAGGRAYFTEVTKRAHDLSNVVFTQPALTDWLLDPNQAPPQEFVWEEPKGYANGHELEVPFVPGAEISRAVRFRICKDVLESLCLAAPEKLAAKPMAGYVRGVSQTKRVGLMSIDVSMSGLHYQGRVEQIRVIPKAPNRLFVQVGLRNLTMTISRSQLNGRLLLSANAGPMHVVIGHRAPVWLTAEIRPEVKNRQLNLKLAGTNFQIQPGNWYVTEPRNVNVRGMPFLRDSISDGLVEGIYERKSEIERQVVNSVPKLIQQMEQQINDVVFGRTTYVGQISMPIWQPRMKTYPEEVIIDDDGITIVSGVVLCALGHVPEDFTMRNYPAPADEPPPIKAGLEIDVSEAVVPAWSELIMAGKVSRFNVLDFSPQEYHDLANIEFLQDMIPDLKRYGDQLEANVHFDLYDPIHLNDPPPMSAEQLVAAPGNPVTLSLKSVPLIVAVRQKGESKWNRVGVLDIGIEREYAPFVRKSGFKARGPKFAELGPFRIEANWKFDPAYEPVITDVKAEEFTAAVLKAREAAQLLEGVKPDSVHDIAMGKIPLRMDEMNWINHHLVVRYQLPGILLTNDSQQPLNYQLRGTLNRWSETFSLAAGESEVLEVPGPVTLRTSNTQQPKEFALSLGNEFVFRVNPEPEITEVKDADLQEEALVPR